MSSQTIITPQKTKVEHKAEYSLRPTSLNNYIGQTAIKPNIKIIIESAKVRGEPADHILLYGPPGLGKTTLAHIIAKELDTPIRATSGPVLERSGDLVATLTSLKPNSILFIDEIHRLKKTLEEILYPAMEDRHLDIILGKGAGAKTMQLSLPPFTLIGATTKMGSLTAPLRDRFGNQLHLDFYRLEELEEIIAQSAKLLKLDIAQPALNFLALRSRKTPRVANRLLLRVRDFAVTQASQNHLTLPLVEEAVGMLNIDQLGLTDLDRRYLGLLTKEFAGQPVGIKTLAAAIQEELETIEEVVEPFLLTSGLIQRTSRGRLASAQAFQHLGVEIKLSAASVNQGKLLN